MKSLTLLLIASALTVRAQHIDPDLTVGPDKCGECHKAEIAVWKETKHNKSFYELTRSEEGRAIAEKMGLRRIKRESDCLDCHFTSINDEGTIKPIAGISCESCHGAARDWVNIHNDFGGEDAKKEDESPEHREKRIAQAKENGMLRPENLYVVAQNCFQCHTVPNEKLVNVGGHKAGSDFELVSWSQGEVRHNFLHSADGETNVPASPERKRILFLMGQALDLEYGLRGTARATEKADYAVAMAKRTKRAALRIQKINEIANLPELASMLEIANGVELKLNNEAALTASADKIAELAKSMGERVDGSKLQGLDALIPDASATKGTPAL